MRIRIHSPGLYFSLKKVEKNLPDGKVRTGASLKTPSTSSNLRHVSTCHIQVVGEAEEERPGVTGQIVANPFNHPVKVRRVRRALNTDHPGSSLSARDLAENSIYVKHCFF